MNRQMTPERLFYEKGVGAYGEFMLYMPFSDYCGAAFLRDPEYSTEVFVRFSRALGRKGSSETARDVRGMEVKFFTEDGEYDLLCQNLPVFLINSAEKFPKLYKALKPDNGFSKDREKFWRFMADNPETFHMLIWLFSSKGTIKSYINMEAFSVNTYIWRNNINQKFFVRYRWTPFAGVKNISAQESEFLAGYEPDTMTLDLYNAIENNRYPEYELSVQLIPCEEAEKLSFDIHNKTLIWPERLFPYVKVGKLVLNRIPNSFHDEVEMSYFSPSNTVKGIELPKDDLLGITCFACDEGFRNRRR